MISKISVFQPYLDTAYISTYLFPLIDPSIQFIDLREHGYSTLDVEEPEDCGDYFAQKVSEALMGTDSEERPPMFNTVEEFLAALKK